MNELWKGYADVYVCREPSCTVSYRTANFVFEEGLRDGKWVSLSYNASGYLMAANDLPAPVFMDYDKFSEPQSFALNVDGQDLASHWTLEDVSVQRKSDIAEARVTLVHTVRPVRVTIVTRLDGTPILQRRLVVENTGERSAAVSQAAPLSGGVQQLSQGRVGIDGTGSPYRLGYMEQSTWGHEGDFRWHDLPGETYTVRGRVGRERFRHPMFALESKRSGECFIGQLGWSAGYAFDFDLNQEDGGSALLSMKLRVGDLAPLKVIAPGETYETPPVHFGAVFGGLDEAVQAMHEHVRKSVMLPPTRGVTGWIETGIGPEYSMDIDSTLKALDWASAVGSEIFFIDAGWYTPPFTEGEEWWKRAGDWRYDKQRYPDGIEQVRDKAHEKGLLFGMWMDADRVGPMSAVSREHPDWIARGYDGKKNGSGLLNLADPKICAWMEENIRFLIDEYGIDMFRLDNNVDRYAFLTANERDGYLENAMARYYENVYGMYARLREAYPKVIFESCAGGGGRTDLGMVANFTHSWVTDWQKHPNALRITNGMTMALPPECVDRLVGGQAAFLTADLAMQMRNLLFARPTIGGIKPKDTAQNPGQVAIIRHHVDIYKRFVRPMQRESRFFHHTPELPGAQASGVAIMELASKDASRDMLGVFALAEGGETETRVVPRGLDPARDYRVTLDNKNATCVQSGFRLTQDGLLVRLGGALTSELILFEAI